MFRSVSHCLVGLFLTSSSICALAITPLSFTKASGSGGVHLVAGTNQFQAVCALLWAKTPTLPNATFDRGDANGSCYYRYTSGEEFCVLNGSTSNCSSPYFPTPDEACEFMEGLVPSRDFQLVNLGTAGAPIWRCRNFNAENGSFIGDAFMNTQSLTNQTAPFGSWTNISIADPKNNGGCCDPVSNPINPGVGNKFQVETDYVGTGSFGLRFERTYNAAALVQDGRLGANWRTSYDRRVVVSLTTAGQVRTGVPGAVHRPDGKIFYFDFAAGQFTPQGDIADRLAALTTGTQIVGFIYTTASGDEVETYDATGRLLTIANSSGLTQVLTYDGAGHLTFVADPFGRALQLGYDTAGRIQTMTDPAGGVFTYAYSGAGNLASVTLPGGAKRIYHYNEPAQTGGANLPNALTGITDENSVRFATYTYDSQGLATATTHAGSANQASLTYSAAETVVTDALGTVRTLQFQNILAVAKRTQEMQPAASGGGNATRNSTYDANGNVSSQSDWNGNRTDYTYDLARNLETSRIEGLTIAGVATPQARTIGTQWHGVLRLPTGVAEPLRITTNVYDPDGTQCGARAALCSKTIQPTTDASGAAGFGAAPAGAARSWSYTYNANGSVLTVDGPRTDLSDSTTSTYYANDDPEPGKRGNLSASTNAAGHVTSISQYNAHGQPLSIVDPNGLVTTLAYDSRRRLSSRTVGSEITLYDYDGVGQLTKVTLPDGSFLSYAYDAAHRLSGMQDSLGNRVAYTLDAMGNRTQEQVFDPTNNLAQTRSRVYSYLNLLFQEIGAASQVTEYGYDNQSNLTSVKDPLNRITRNQYDALNRLRLVTDPGTGVTLYAYNGLDALTQVTDPRGIATGYATDGLGNLTLQQSPDTGNTVNTYDSAGNLLTQTDAKGQVTAYAYDVLNRVTSITFHDSSRQIYAYDQGANGLGRLASVTERDPANQATSLIAYTYDPHGRVTAETRTVAGVAYALGYVYDGAGRLSGMTYPSGRTIAYGLDALGRISQITTTKDGQSQVMVQGVSYQPFGGLKGFTLGNGQTYTRSIDLDGRIASYTLGATNFALSFDPASRITAIGANTYGYDALDRLTQALLPAANYGYSYDAVGNRLTKTVGASTDTYAYPSTSNRIASIASALGAVRNFVFDANGSTTNDGQNTYAYDARGRMVQAVSTLGTTSYQVNALGQRVRKTNSLGDTVFHYDTRGRLIAETDAAGSVRREYLYLGDLPVGLAVAGAASGGAEAILDNGSGAFTTTGTWPVSTAVAGFIGTNYQVHEANGAPPSGIVVDNSDAGFSTTGTWAASTAVSGYVGANYQHHYANGEPPGVIVADNASGVAVGTWPVSTSVGGYLGANYLVHTAGTGSNTFTWTLNAPVAGSYAVYARWTQHPNRATNARYTVNHAGGATVVTVNQEQGGGLWNLLGTFNLAAGAMTISLSDQANEYVVADGVMIVPPGAAPNTATWSATLPSAGTYQVYARWTQHPNRATDAKYTVNHAGGSTTVTVNQVAGGGTWRSLGSFSFNTGSASVSLTDRANGYVIADAVMFAPPGAGANSATWTPNLAQAGTYEVYARWTAHANRATNATYAVTHAGGTTAVAVNQQANGGVWNLLGNFSLSPGAAHKVTLTDQANGYVIADALRLVPISLQTGPQYFYVHPDHQGTPRLIANLNKQTVWRWDQAEPFGVNVPDENPSGPGTFELPLRLPGQHFDKETNNHYNMMRDYDPGLGMYKQSDPIGLRAGLNTYVYGSADPLWYTDKLGLAYFALRPLDNPLGQSVGIIAPSPLQTLNLALAHEQLFFEDGLPYSNLGFFEDGTVRPDSNLAGYVPMKGSYNDCIMRKAVAQTPALAQYRLLCANCQTWASEVRRQYTIAASDPKVQQECGCKDPGSAVAKGAAAAAGLYILYRVVRMIPSLFVPPTIPINAAIP